MPILDIQTRFRELGRIRTGRKVPTRNNKLRPEKLARFRLTSQWEHLIEQAAAVFGGEARPWENEGRTEFEVIVEVDSIPVVIPPGEILDQWYEMWTGGGCQRRCDGVNQVLTARPCQCPKDPIERQELAAKNPPQACKPTTRLRLMIPEVSDVGIWRLESHGFHAAAELGGSAGLVEAATRQGAMIPADLRLQAREGARRPGQPSKKFFVPALSFRGALGPTLDALGVLEEGATMPRLLGVEPGKPSLEAGGRQALPAGGTAFDPAPTEAPSFPGTPPEPIAPEAHQAPTSEPIEASAAPVPPTEPFAPETAAQSVTEPDELPTPEGYDPPAPAGQEPRYSGPQIVAMRFDARGISDRTEKLAIIRTLLRRPVSSAKDLNAGEISLVLDVVNDEVAWNELLDEHRSAPFAEEAASPSAADDAPPPEAGPSPAPEESSAQHVPASEVQVVGGPPRATPASEAVSPRGWSADEWKAYLRSRGVKAVELLREAQRLASEHNISPAPHSLEGITGSGLEEILVGFVEDTAAARK